jgi:putative tricarboxylic transport membrane protein
MQADRRHDLWFSALLVVLAAGVVVESWRMPRLEHLGVHPMSAPGLTPGVLGLVLLALATALLVRSVRQRRPAGDTVEAAEPGTLGRTLVTLALCLGYAAGLVGRVPFWLATGLFVLAFVGWFGWERDRPARSALNAIVMAVVTSAAVTLLFERVFLVRLP